MVYHAIIADSHNTDRLSIKPCLVALDPLLDVCPEDGEGLVPPALGPVRRQEARALLPLQALRVGTLLALDDPQRSDHNLK